MHQILKSISQFHKNYTKFHDFSFFQPICNLSQTRTPMKFPWEWCKLPQFSAIGTLLPHTLYHVSFRVRERCPLLSNHPFFFFFQIGDYSRRTKENEKAINRGHFGLFVGTESPVARLASQELSSNITPLLLPLLLSS